MENSKTVNGLHSRRKQVETGKVIFAFQLSTTTVIRTRSTSIELITPLPANNTLLGESIKWTTDRLDVATAHDLLNTLF